MPTVDDLTISLTIKDNSNLDQLRKDIDALLKGGTLPNAGDLSDTTKGMEDLAKALIGIEQQMDFLLPTVSPASTNIAGLRDYGRRVSGNLEKFKSNIASYLTPERLGSLSDLVKDLNLEGAGIEDVQAGVEKLVDKYNTIAQALARGELIMSGSRAKRWLDTVRDVINRIEGTGGLTALREIEKGIPEDIIQRTLERLLLKAGVSRRGQFGMYKVGVKGEKEEKFEEWLGKPDKPLVDKYRPMFKDKSLWTGLMKAMKDLGYSPDELDSILNNYMDIKDNDEIKGLISSMYTLYKEGTIKDLWIPRSFNKLIQEEIGFSVRSSGSRTMTKLDINVLTKDVEKLKEIIPNLSQETIDLIKSTGVMPFELKAFLNAQNLGNIPQQTEIYGSKNLKIIASMITPAIREDLEKMGIEYYTIPDFTDRMIKAGVLSQAQTQEQLKEAMKDVASQMSVNKMIKKINEVIKGISSIASMKELRPLVDVLTQAEEMGIEHGVGLPEEKGG
jgi:uncharacterized protein YunC (DUF1805 family)